MNDFSYAHLDNGTLERRLEEAIAGDRAGTATMVALIAELDERRFYLEQAYPSMFAYCVHKLHLSEQEAFKRIRVARVARKCPAVFAAVAENRVHLSGVTLLAAHLTPENAEELLAVATHRTCAEIEQLLAERFPRPDLPTRGQDLSTPPALPLPPGTAEPGIVEAKQTQLSARRVEPAEAQPKVAPLSLQRYGLQFSVGQRAYDKLRYVQALLGHHLPMAEIEQVFEGALDAYVERLEKQRFAKTSHPRTTQCSSGDPRHIPAAVKRAVWERDGGQCGFVSGDGRRCPARTHLEFDHIDPVARGGQATVEGIRLRCRAHNQYEAECMFGAGFMARKREAARQTVDEARARAEVENDPERSVIPWLRRLGYRLPEAREAALICARMPDAPMAEKIRAALRSFPSRTVPATRLA